MVDTQVRPNDVHDRRVIAAMGAVPREDFLPEAKRALAYTERDLETLPGRWLWEARDFSKLIQAADVQEGDKVLDIAAGSGYSTEILRRLGAKVVALEELDAGLAALKARFEGAEDVSVVSGPLAQGAADSGPFDAIFVNGAVDVVPMNWLDQLVEGGRLTVIVREGDVGRARVYTKAGAATSWRTAFDAHVPMLPGFEKEEEFRL